MPLFKGISSKSTPDKAIRYITDPKKGAAVSVRNLFEDEDYAQQFMETANRFGKGSKRDERKYYHFKLSCAQKDKVTPEEAQVYAEELTARLFRDCECVIATHTDTKTIHSHIVVNAVNPVTGRKLRILKNDYTDMKDEANQLGEEMGFTSTDFRKKSENKRTSEESHIILKGGNSWKEDLREVIEEAKRKATTQEEFISHLQLYNVSVTRSISEYSFLHPQKQKSIRGKRLGENYSKEIIENAIAENRYGRNGEAVTGVTKNQYTESNTGITGEQRLKEGTIRKRPLERSVSDIQREMQRLNRTAEYDSKGADMDSQGDSDTNIKAGSEHRRESKQGDSKNGINPAQHVRNTGGHKTNSQKRDDGFSK